MLTLIRLRHNPEIPTVGVELKPTVLVSRSGQHMITNDVPEWAPIDNCFLSYKWYRIESDKKVAKCGVHRYELAKVECVECKEFTLPSLSRYHCSPRCYSDAWPYHRAMHDRARAAKEAASASSSTSSTNASVMYPVPIKRGGETWYEVGRSRTYTPTIDDLGDVLMFQCIVLHAGTKQALGNPYRITTISPVIPAPAPYSSMLIQ